MKGFVNRLLKICTMLRTFQMPLVSTKISNSLMLGCSFSTICLLSLYSASTERRQRANEFSYLAFSGVPCIFDPRLFFFFFFTFVNTFADCTVYNFVHFCEKNMKNAGRRKLIHFQLVYNCSSMEW